MKKNLFTFLFTLLVFSVAPKAQTCNAITNSANDTVCMGDTLHFLTSGAVVKNCISFDGFSSYLSAPDSPTLNSIGNQMTITVWVNLIGTSSDQKILGKTTVGFNGGYLMGVQAGNIYYELWNSAATHYSLNTGAVTAGTWTHLALTYSAGGNMIAYVNGVQTGTVAVANLSVGTNSNPFIVGSAPWDPANFFHVNGMIDEIRIYNTALSQAQIAASMNNQISPGTSGLVDYWPMDEGAGSTTADITTNANNLSFAGSPSWTVPSTCPVNPVFTTIWSPATALSSASISNPIFTPTIVGTTTYTVLVTNITTLCADTDTIITHVIAAPSVSIGSDTSICLGAAPFILNGSPSGGTLGGSSGVIFGHFNPDINGAGLFPVTYTYTNLAGCTATDSMWVTVHALPTVFAGTDVTICQGGIYHLSATGTGTFSWSPTSGLSNPNISSPIASPLSDTDYIVTLTNSFGCSNSDTLKVKVKTCTGIEEKFTHSDFHLYPNPSSGATFLKIENQNLLNVPYEVLDVLGQIVLRGTINTSKDETSILRIDLFGAGLYLFRIVSEGEVIFSEQVIITN